MAVQPTVELASATAPADDPLIDETELMAKPARSACGQHDAAPANACGILTGRGDWRWAAPTPRGTSSSTRSTPIRRRRRGRRSGHTGGSPVTDLRPPAQGVPGLDADDPRAVAHRAGVRGQRPAAVLRAVPALRRDAVAEVRPAALAEGPPGDGGISLRGLRDAHRGASQDGDAGERRMAGDRHCRRSDHGRVSPLGALFADRWLSWERIVRAWDAARVGQAIKAFRNTILGRHGSRPGNPTGSGLRRRERWTSGTARGGLFLTAGADVEGPHRGRRLGPPAGSGLVDHIVIRRAGSA